MTGFCSIPVYKPTCTIFTICYKEQHSYTPYIIFLNEIALVLNIEKEEVEKNILNYHGVLTGKHEIVFALNEQANTFCEEWLNPRLILNMFVTN